MDRINGLEKLARLARKDKPPTTDVSARVLVRIMEHRPAPVLPLSLFAAASAVAAAVVLLLAISGWISPADPMPELFSPLEVLVL